MSPPGAVNISLGYPDHSGWPECRDPQYGTARDSWENRSKLDWARPAGELDGDSSRHEDLDRTPGPQTESDVLGIPAGSCEIDTGGTDAGAYGRIGSELPARTEAQTSLGCSHDQRYPQPQQGWCKSDQRWKRHHCTAEFGAVGGGKDLLQDGREAFVRNRSVAEEIFESGYRRDALVFIDFEQARWYRWLCAHLHHPDRVGGLLRFECEMTAECARDHAGLADPRSSRMFST